MAVMKFCTTARNPAGPMRHAARGLAGVRRVSMSASVRGSAALPIVRVHLDSVDSTNSYARTHAKDFLPGALTVVTTDNQRAGRGRTTRVWKSTGDDLAATFAFQLPTHALSTAYLLSPLLAVLATRALAKQGFKADIKWPNDIIVGQCRKVGGILCELEATGAAGYWAALGIGINVNSTPGELGVARPIWPLTTLRAEAGGARQDVARLANDLADEVAEVSGGHAGAGGAGGRTPGAGTAALLLVAAVLGMPRVQLARGSSVTPCPHCCSSASCCCCCCSPPQIIARRRFPSSWRQDSRPSSASTRPAACCCTAACGSGSTTLGPPLSLAGWRPWAPTA